MIETFCHDPIALTGGLFETVPINNGDLAALVTDQPCVLKGASSHRDGSAWSAHHEGNDFLGKVNSVSFHPVVGYQKPAAESLFRSVKAITNGRLGDLGNQRVCVAKQQACSSPPRLNSAQITS